MRNIYCLLLAMSVLCFLPTTAEAQLFYPSVEYDVYNFPESVAIGDLNGDGAPDLAVANNTFYGHQVTVLLGNGDGTFLPYVGYGAAEEPNAVAIGDLDNDGNLDLAVSSYDYWPFVAAVSVLMGNGDGTFQEAIILWAGGEPYSVAISDLDGDSDLDLAVANCYTFGQVAVLLGNGDGTFQEAVFYEAGSGSYSVAISDLDGDGAPDLAVANSGDDNVSILLGRGDGTFQAAVNYWAGTAADELAIGDLDGDGNLDLAVGLFTLVAVLLGNGDGTFQEAVHYEAGIHPVSVAIGDLNGDGNPDLATANSLDYNVSVLLGNGDGTFQAPDNYAVGGWQPLDVAIGDLNGDSYPDLAVANSGTEDVSIFINTGHTFEGTISAEMTCVPPTGTVPFDITFTVELTNNYTGYGRRVDARIDVLTAGGMSIPGWKFGQVDICPGFTVNPVFSQTIPACPTVFGTNLFTLVAEDVTPAPYNQPPYPLSGDTDTATCTVTGIAPLAGEEKRQHWSID